MQKIMVTIMAIMVACATVTATEPGRWHETENSEMRTSVTAIDRPGDADEIEISASKGTITIKIQNEQTVKVFTILGQPVNSSILPAGTWELKINSRGIYIIKIGNLTQKVAL